MGYRPMNRLLVYGTLMPNDGSPVIAVKGRMFDLGHYPGVVDIGTADSTVLCQVIEVSDSRLNDLDRYEGFCASDPSNSLYIRIRHGDAYIYQYNGDVTDRPQIASGDWLSLNKQKGMAHA